ncbi:acyltransferase family protein [Granulicella arctica]|uniref:Peptidoglycan/LPS O-acetylase OafA/YrhL n=1 Tax=Granulicella arctica TaxID=940613 RepID=A0A7Y9PHI1_9BACT|nr:acyltransferase [Granulicella arctica]NYF79922.1 peptidoglycan/LPS O-acetylase OafA/YrhL [Granulicella arctica]
MASTTISVCAEMPPPADERVSHNVVVGRRFYRPELDALRFFAFLAVFVHHSMYTFVPVISRSGAYGLSLFFFLSAFLITELLQREKHATGSIAIREFYIRRGLRIWPLYFGFLLFTVWLAWVLPSYRAPVGMLVCFALLIGNSYIGRHGFPNNPASFLWSISVEEQFYLFWPLLNRHCSRRTLALIALATMPVGSVTVLILRHLGASTNIGIWTNSLVEFQFFGFGVLVSLALSGRVPELPMWFRICLLATGAALWLAAAQWTGINNFDRQSALGPVAGYYIVGFGCIAIFLGAYGIAARWLPAWLVYLGKISYGLYVFHELSLEIAERVVHSVQVALGNTSHAIFGVVHFSLGLGLSIGVAWVSYRYFESPFLRLKEKFAVIRSRAV